MWFRSQNFLPYPHDGQHAAGDALLAVAEEDVGAATGAEAEGVDVLRWQASVEKLVAVGLDQVEVAAERRLSVARGALVEEEHGVLGLEAPTVEDILEEFGGCLLYTSQQQEDELNCYVFELSAKKMEKGKRYFEGRIWVDDRDYQIVKTYGKNVPDVVQHKHGRENLFPRFTTWREQIDGKYLSLIHILAAQQIV